MSHRPVQGQDGDGKDSRTPTPPSHNYFSWLTWVPSQLDAGQHPAYDGLAALPFYDDFDLSTVDVLLISQ